MTFDKKQYRENREKGIRGQGIPEPFPPMSDEEKDKSHKDGSHIANIGGKLQRVNRKDSRVKFINHKMQSKTARIKSPEEDKLVQGRVKRKEAGEQERIAKKKADELAKLTLSAGIRLRSSRTHAGV